MVKRRAAAALTALTLASAACTALVGIDGSYERAGASEEAGAGADANGPLDAGTLEDARGDTSLVSEAGLLEAGAAPPLVALEGGFAVGAIEVTRREYTAWLATSPRLDHQPAACAWNATFAPDGTCMKAACTGLGCDDHPQVCIDWCDAFAFCDAMGQRLCGKIGGGAESSADYANAARSQWFAACSVGGTRAYPYGNGYHVGYCNGGDNQQTGCVDGGTCQTVIAGSSLRCVADAPSGAELFDMSGNAAEWSDACSASADGGPSSDACRIRGGSYKMLGDVRVRCTGDPTLDLAARSTTAPDVGARCCSR